MSMYEIVSPVLDPVTACSLLCVRENGCMIFAYAANERLCRLGGAVIDQSLDSVDSIADVARFTTGKHNRA